MDLLADLRFCFRTLIKNPGFSIVAVSILALGIGVNAAVFTVTNAVLFRGFPGLDPDNRILYIDSPKGVSYPDVQDWRAQAKSFDDIAAVDNGGLRLLLNGAQGSLAVGDGTRLSANSFQVLGVRPIFGRDFAPSDEAPGAAPVAILTYAFWQRQFRADLSLIGKTIRLDKNPTTVIGIMPPGFDFPHHRVDLWVPLALAPERETRQNRTLWFAFGRLANGATLRSAQADMDTVGRRLESAYPVTNQGVHPRVLKFDEAFIGRNAAAFYGAIWGAVGFVLLIACANLANLLLARAMGRSREISVRIALGAGRWRIIRQLLLESLLLSSLGGVLGWWIAGMSVRAYQFLANPPGSYNRWTYALDARVGAYLVVISVATGVLFGLAPALRLSKLDVNAALKDGGRGITGAGRKGLATLLITGEMALAVVLLAGAGLMIRSFLKIYTADLGFRTSNLLTAAVRLPIDRYPGAPAQIAFFEGLATRLKALPGVSSLALANSLPGLYAPRFPYEVGGVPSGAEPSGPTVSTVIIGPGYFHCLAAAVLAGREFTDFDGASGPPVAIVNQRFASLSWPGDDPVGKRLHLVDKNKPDAWRTVVGVVSDIVQNDNTGQSFHPVVYVPFRQRPAVDMDVVAQTRVPPRGLERAFRHEIQTIDSELVVYSGLGSLDGPAPLTESLAINNYWSRGMNATLFLIFAAMAIFLAALGVYAVLAHSVSQRTPEIGIRMAVGATTIDILKLVLLQGMLPLAIGLGLGLTGSLALTRILKSELVQVSPADPLTLVVASTALVSSALLGCWIPARRAMRVDPIVALRHE